MNKYLQTLVLYYEEEVVGEAYFYGLVKFFDEKDKLSLLARVERQAADAVVPLLKKYELSTRDESILKALGENDVAKHESFDWPELISHILNRYPGYLDDFEALQRMAPDEDFPALQDLTNHEIAAIEFAKKELAREPDSVSPLLNYLAR